MAAKSSNKVLRQLGLQVADLVTQAFTANAKGALNRDEFYMFWSQVQGGPREATEYLVELLSRISANMETEGAAGVSTDTLVNSVVFALLNLTLNLKHPGVTKWLANWDNAQKNSDIAHRAPMAVEAARLLKQRVEGLDVSGTLIVSATSPNRQEMEVLDGKQELFCQGDRVYFSYPYLLSASPRLNILKLTIGKMKQVNNIVKTHPVLAGVSLLSMLHIIRGIASRGPVTDPSFFKDAFKELQAFYLWFNPFGIATKQVLELLQAEMLCPGAFMRNELLHEGRNPEVDGFDDPWGQRARAAYYFINPADLNALSYAHMMELPGLQKPTHLDGLDAVAARCKPKLAPPTQALVVMSTLHASCGLSSEEASLFRTLTTDQVDKLYQEILAVEQEGLRKHSTDEAMQTCRARLSALKARLPSLAEEAGSVPTASHGGGARIVNLPSKFPDNFDPPLPRVAHIMVRSELGYQIVSKDQLKLMRLAYTPYPTVKAREWLDIIFNSHPGSPDNPIDLRLVIGGGDDLMHNFLCAYAGLLQERPQALNGVNPRFFVIPLGNNAVANFIARHDMWYQRHVYIPFRMSTFMAPWIRVDERGMSAEAKVDEITPSGKFLRGLTEMYMREALVTTHFNVYHIACWNRWEESSEEAPDQVIPMLQRFEIGKNAEAYDFARAYNLKMRSNSMADITSDRRFAFNPPDLRIAFTKIDLHGRPQGTVIDEGCSFDRLLLSNVPHPGDQCFPPDPSSPWLEMYCESSESAKSKQRLRKNVLMTDSKQHVNDIAISSVNVDQQFLVRIDHQNFGPFNHVTITPLRVEGRDNLTLPIQHFFPITV